MQKIMQKKIFGLGWIVTILLFGMSIQRADAMDYYYKNEHGVILSEYEYQYLSQMYWEGYQENLTKDIYDLMKQMNIFNNKLQKNITTNYPITRGSVVTSNLRTLSISKSCSNTCMISLAMEWLGTPTIKSYDVMGARLENTSISRLINTVVSGKNYSKSYTNFKSFGNGFGISILVPNVDNVKTATTFITTNSGTIYGSYQHAKRNITEAVSKNYTIGLGGYGNVFHFNSNAVGVYDDAPGVSI